MAKSVFLTGSSGFIGKNFITYFNNSYKIRTYKRKSNISISEEIVVHFAGKAHDLKKTANSKEYYEINTETLLANAFTKVFDLTNRKTPHQKAFKLKSML